MKTYLVAAVVCALSAVVLGSQAHAGSWTQMRPSGTDCTGVLLCAQTPANPETYHKGNPSDHRWDGSRMTDSDWRMKDKDWKMKDNDWSRKDKNWRMKDYDWQMRNRNPVGPYGWQRPLSTGMPY